MRVAQLIPVFASLTLALAAGTFLVLRDEASSVPMPAAINANPIVAAETTLTFDEQATVKISGAPMWLFAVDDGEDRPALSAEHGNAIVMGRLDLSAPESAVAWTTVASSVDTGGEGIADHWHIFAHGYHYIVFSTQGAHRAFLLQLTKDFARVALTPIVESAVGFATNDMFLVEEKNGIAVGFFVANQGHRIFRFTVDGIATTTAEIGGGDYVHSNGASAMRTSQGTFVLAPEKMNMLESGRLWGLTYDEAWTFARSVTLVDEDGANVGMASGVWLDDDTLVVHARYRDDAYPFGTLPPPPANPGVFTDDGGALVRFVFRADGTLISRDTLVEGERVHRPHTALFGDTLVTTWDTTGESFMRLDTISR